ALELPRLLRLGRGEDQSGGRERESILATTLEAGLGAVYLDGGIDAARVAIRRVTAWEPETMRLWPARPRRRSAAPPPEDVLVTEEQLRRSVEDVLVVRDRQVRGSVVVFRGVLTIEARRALELLIDRFRPFGYTPFLRQEGDTVAVQAWPLAETA